MKLIKRFAQITAVVFFLFNIAYGGDYEDGEEAYNSGDYETAIKLLTKAAEKGHSDAPYSLGWMYQNGEGVIQNNEKAAEWYLKGAEQGNASAQLELGVMYYNGEGVLQDYGEAIEWLKKAAKQNNVDAQYNLGIMYQYGYGVTENIQLANEWYSKAARLHIKDAEAGDAYAQYYIGLMYLDGLGLVQNDKEALSWFQKAAEQGFAEAIERLGFMVNNGRGITEEEQQAVKLYTKAEQGDAEAQLELGLMYLDGNGVEQDVAQSIEWVKKAAEQNNAHAQYLLGFAYENGIETVVDIDIQLATEWYKKAEEQGHVEAKIKLEAINENSSDSIDGLYITLLSLTQKTVKNRKWYLCEAINLCNGKEFYPMCEAVFEVENRTKNAIEGAGSVHAIYYDYAGNLKNMVEIDSNRGPELHPAYLFHIYKLEAGEKLISRINGSTDYPTVGQFIDTHCDDIKAIRITEFSGAWELVKNGIKSSKQIILASNVEGVKLNIDDKKFEDSVVKYDNFQIKKAAKLKEEELRKKQLEEKRKQEKLIVQKQKEEEEKQRAEIEKNKEQWFHVPVSGNRIQKDFVKTNSGRAVLDCVAGSGSLSVTDVILSNNKGVDDVKGVLVSLSKQIGSVQMDFAVDSSINQAKLIGAKVIDSENDSVFNLMLHLEFMCGGEIAQKILPEQYREHQFLIDFMGTKPWGGAGKITR